MINTDTQNANARKHFRASYVQYKRNENIDDKHLKKTMNLL